MAQLLRSFVVPLVFVAMSGASVLSHAATVSFVDHIAFQNAAGPLQTFDFDDPVLFPLDDGVGPFGPFEDLTTQLPGLTFENSVVTAGDDGGTSRSAPLVVLNKDIINAIVINFTQPLREVGLFNTSLVDAETLEVFDANDILLGSLALSSAAINFGGFISDELIAKAVITPLAPTNGSIFIDDLMISAVPIPAALPMFISAIGVAGYAQRRKQKQAAAT